jgi:DNA-directed RNA polymerase specialized sigma24 family protein
MKELTNLIEAVESGDSEQINIWAGKVHSALVDYLVLRYRASQDDARDCVQETLSVIFDKMNNGTLSPDNPGAYVLATARNHYFKIYNENKRTVGDEILEMDFRSDSDPSTLLADSQMMDLLRKCISKLAEFPRKIVSFLLHHPDVKAEVVAEYFNTTPNNIWTRKHRINQELLQCMQKEI